MTNALRDQNFVESKLGVLFSDGETLVPIKVDSSNFGMKINTTDSVGAGILALYAAGKPIPRDTNNVPAWSAQSSASASVSFPIFVDADGSVLIDM